MTSPNLAFIIFIVVPSIFMIYYGVISIIDDINGNSNYWDNIF